MTGKSTFLARMEADGWTLLDKDDRNELLAEIAPNGDAQYRRGVVTLSISNGAIYEAKHGVVAYFDENGLILNAILVERDHRHQGHGRRAMQSLIAACRPKGQDPLRLKLEAGSIGRGFVDETTDLTPTALVAWYQTLGFVLDAGSAKCMEYQVPDKDRVYDFGLARGDEPEWEKMEVDSIAAWILKHVPDNQVPTCVRAIATAYEKSTQNWGVNSPTQELFLRCQHDNVLYECEIHEKEDTSGNFDGALIQGTIHFIGRKISVRHDTISMPAVSETATQGIKTNTPAKRLVDIAPLEGRLVDSVETEQQTALVKLKPKEHQLWDDLFPGWP